MTITFPYNLQEGSIAYARHVMADLNAIKNALENLSVAGISATTLEGILASLVVKNQEGNADEILDGDGETLQEKLDRHAFDGRDASLYDGYAQFHVNANGHLIVTLPVNDPDMYSVDANGHLILTVGESGDTDTVDFDLGLVKGAQGAQGETGAQGPTSTSYTATVYAADGTGENPAAWNSDSTSSDYRKAVITCEGITATNNFLVQPHTTGTVATDDTAASAWSSALVRVISQAAGSCVLYARGTLPASDITLDIVCNV